MSIDWEALAASVFVVVCVGVLWWAIARYARTTPELWTGAAGRALAWWRTRRLMRGVDVDEQAWNWYVEDWYARNGTDDLMDLADEVFSLDDQPLEGGEGGSR